MPANIALPCRLYEQGLAYVGSDYLAHGLWDKYVQYETSLGELPRVVALYMRTLAVPLRELELDRYFSRLAAGSASQWPFSSFTASPHAV